MSQMAVIGKNHSEMNILLAWLVVSNRHPTLHTTVGWGISHIIFPVSQVDQK